jgi:hypothetical protein
MAITDFSEPRVFLEGIKGSYAGYQSLFQEEVNYLRTDHPYAQQWYQSEKEKVSNGVLEALDQLKSYSQQNTGDKIQNLYESGTDARRMVIILTGAFLVLCVAISLSSIEASSIPFQQWRRRQERSLRVFSRAT